MKNGCTTSRGRLSRVPHGVGVSTGRHEGADLEAGYSAKVAFGQLVRDLQFLEQIRTTPILRFSHVVISGHISVLKATSQSLQDLQKFTIPQKVAGYGRTLSPTTKSWKSTKSARNHRCCRAHFGQVEGAATTKAHRMWPRSQRMQPRSANVKATLQGSSKRGRDGNY